MIETAFNNYRELLSSFMIELNAITCRMTEIEYEYGDVRRIQLRNVHDKFRNMVSLVPFLWEKNEVLLRELINPISNLQLVYGIVDELKSNKDIDPVYKSFKTTDGECSQNFFSGSYNALDQVLVHLSRDWSEAGKAVRHELYINGIIRTVALYFDSPLPQNQTVQTNIGMALVPGAALGRLAVELAGRGFRVELNEVSACMVCAFHGIMNLLRSGNASREVYPQLDFLLSDDWDFAARLEPHSLPFIADSAELTQAFSNASDADRLLSRLSVQLGDFQAVYSPANSLDHAARFDLVVTCFFLDATEDILAVLSTIHHILRPGGLWVNAGPLHYHHYLRHRSNFHKKYHQQYQKPPRTVPYSYAQLLEVIAAMGFDYIEIEGSQQQPIAVSYCGEDVNSMKPETYRVPVAAFRRRDE